MNISVNVQLLEGDEPVKEDTTELAESILVLFGGDKGKDFCQVTITQPMPAPGIAGTLAAPPPPPEPETSDA
jgi:hypothetical protein